MYYWGNQAVYGLIKKYINDYYERRVALITGAFQVEIGKMLALCACRKRKDLVIVARREGAITRTSRKEDKKMSIMFL